MREYETTFVIRPDSADSQASQLLDRVNGIIERHGGTILQQKNWGKRELAFPVKRCKQGLYYYYNYAGDTSLVSELERALKLHDLPIRFLTVKLSDVVDIEARKKEIAEIKEDVSETSAPTPAVTEEEVDNV